MAYLILEGRNEQEIIQSVRHQYRVSANQASRDLANFNIQLDNLIRPDGACPVHELDLEAIMPFSTRPSAPYRMDLALPIAATMTVHTVTTPANGTSRN